MATLRATDTLVILREMNATAEAIAATIALVNAADGKGLILEGAEAIRSQLSKAQAAASYGRDWLLKTPDLITDMPAEPVALLVAAE